VTHNPGAGFSGLEQQGWDVVRSSTPAGFFVRAFCEEACIPLAFCCNLPAVPPTLLAYHSHHPRSHRPSPLSLYCLHCTAAPLLYRTHSLSAARLSEVQKELAALEDQLAPLLMKYKQEKERLDTIRRLQNKRQELLVALEMAEQRQDLARIAGGFWVVFVGIRFGSGLINPRTHESIGGTAGPGAYMLSKYAGPVLTDCVSPPRHLCLCKYPHRHQVRQPVRD
jgi:hypothetical protein